MIDTNKYMENAGELSPLTKWLIKENEQLKKENEILLGQLVINDGEDVTVQISKSQFDEYNQFKDMAKKGLEEFKDVGGCWGCGLQLQLNQDMEDIKQLKAENEQLEKEKKINLQRANALNRELNQLQTCLQEIKAIVCGNYEIIDSQGRKDILKLITKVEEE